MSQNQNDNPTPDEATEAQQADQTTAGYGQQGFPGDNSGYGDPPPVKKLERIPEGKMIAGVCTGVADYLGIDVTLVRIGAAVSVFFSGLGIVAYVIAMIVVPQRQPQS